MNPSVDNQAATQCVSPSNKEERISWYPGLVTQAIVAHWQVQEGIEGEMFCNLKCGQLMSQFLV